MDIEIQTRPNTPQLHTTSDTRKIKVQNLSGFQNLNI